MNKLLIVIGMGLSFISCGSMEFENVRYLVVKDQKDQVIHNFKVNKEDPEYQKIIDAALEIESKNKDFQNAVLSLYFKKQWEQINENRRSHVENRMMNWKLK